MVDIFFALRVVHFALAVFMTCLCSPPSSRSRLMLWFCSLMGH